MASARRGRMSRRFLKASSASHTSVARIDAPRRIRNTLIDFSSLALPADVRRALADAFWNHFGVRRAGQVLLHWAYIKVFVRFAAESHALENLADIRDELLIRYIEWLNAQRRSNGQPWSPWGRAGPYISLRKLLQWLLRCRPGVLGALHFPFNPFPWRNRDSGGVQRLSDARQLRAVLKACERDISALRELRGRGERARIDAGSDPRHSLGALLGAIDGRYGGIVPAHLSLAARGEGALRRALVRHGGTHHVEPYLYPRSESLLPYYLALLIHSAGNPRADRRAVLRLLAADSAAR